MPTIRATTTSELATPWAAAGASASAAALTGAMARPMPRPTATSTTVAGHVDSEPGAPRRHDGQPGRGQHQGRRRHHARRDPPQQHAAEERTDRHREQEADEHEGRRGLRAGKREPGEDGHVDDDGHQRGADEQADRRAQDAHPAADDAARHERLRGRAGVPQVAAHGEPRRPAAGPSPSGPTTSRSGSAEAKVSTSAAEGDRDEQRRPAASARAQHRPPPPGGHGGERDHAATRVGHADRRGHPRACRPAG